MRLNQYIDARLERWVVWRAGGQGVSIAPFSRLRYGTPAGEAPEPRTYTEEIETNEMLGLLTVWEQHFVRAIYPRSVRRLLAVAKLLDCGLSTVYSELARTHAHLQQLLDQRRRGEPVSLVAPRPQRGKAIRVRGFAAVAPTD